MKRFTFVLVAALLLVSCALTGCSGQNKLDSNTQIAWDLTDTEPIFVTEWPENEYTSQVVKPEYGEMDFIYDLSESGRYAVFLKEISREESEAYVEQLKEFGFAEIASDGNDVSIGTLLQKDNIVLSIAISDGGLGMMIMEDVSA